MNEKVETTEEWLKKGNKIKVMHPNLTEVKQFFGKTSSKTKSRRSKKGANK